MVAGRILGQVAANYKYVGMIIEGKWNQLLDLVGKYLDFE